MEISKETIDSQVFNGTILVVAFAVMSHYFVYQVFPIIALVEKALAE